MSYGSFGEATMSTSSRRSKHPVDQRRIHVLLHRDNHPVAHREYLRVGVVVRGAILRCGMPLGQHDHPFAVDQRGHQADGEEVDEFRRTDLSDSGWGYQVFVDFNYRAKRFMIGVSAKYQDAIDFLDIDYSNLRLGGHIGIVF